MNNLIEKTVKHLSKTAERIIPEKSMTDAEIEKLLSDTKMQLIKSLTIRKDPRQKKRGSWSSEISEWSAERLGKKWKSSPQSDYLSNENEHRSEFWKIWIRKIWI